MDVSFESPFKEVQNQLRPQGFLFLLSQKMPRLFGSVSHFATLWTFKQCEWADVRASWTQETLTLVLDPPSKVNHKLSMSHISHLSSEAMIFTI